MKYTIEYHDIPYGGGFMSIPEFTKSEIVDVKDKEQLDSYITSQKDLHGHKFKKKPSSSLHSYDYISNQGGVVVKKYKTPKVKKL